MALLEVTNLGIAFGGLQAVAQLDMKMEKGQLYGLIGPNGAGKTTVFNMLTGVYRPTEGDIILDGKNITGQQPAKINQEGIARTFQNIRLFEQMSVLDNVKIGLHNQVKYSMWTGIFRLPGFREKERQMNKQAMQLLKIFDLDKEAELPASSLPAILLIEHDMNFVMGICEYIYVLDYGRVIAQGTGESIRNNPKVIAAYLGGD